MRTLVRMRVRMLVMCGDEDGGRQLVQKEDQFFLQQVGELHFREQLGRPACVGGVERVGLQLGRACLASSLEGVKHDCFTSCSRKIYQS